MTARAILALVSFIAFATASLPAELPPDWGVFDKEAQAKITPEQALERLERGNARFVAGAGVQRSPISQAEQTSAGQYPFAAIVSCLDSRTSSEIVFDQGIGDIFNARLAGNVVEEDVLGSLEFAAKVAGVKLIMVVGHSSCGAVKGSIDGVELGNLTGLLKRIDPAVAQAKERGGEIKDKSVLLSLATEENVRLQMKNIEAGSPILKELIEKKELLLVGGIHDLTTGRVEFLKD